MTNYFPLSCLLKGFHKEVLKVYWGKKFFQYLNGVRNSIVKLKRHIFALKWSNRIKFFKDRLLNLLKVIIKSKKFAKSCKNSINLFINLSIKTYLNLQNTGFGHMKTNLSSLGKKSERTGVIKWNVMRIIMI